MRLLVMRHGPSEPTPPGKRDFDRELTPEGRERVRTNVLALQSRGEVPERIYSSPLVRTRQTAEIVATLLGGVQVELRDELAPARDATAFASELRRNGTRTAMLVAHAPDVGDLVASLSGTSTGPFDPAMIVALDLLEGGASRIYVIR